MARPMFFGYEGEGSDFTRASAGTAAPARRYLEEASLSEKTHIDTLKYMFANITAGHVDNVAISLGRREYAFFPLSEDEMWHKWESYRAKHGLVERVRLMMNRRGDITGMNVEGQLYAKATKKKKHAHKKRNSRAIELQIAREDAKQDDWREKRMAAEGCAKLNPFGALFLAAVVVNPETYYAYTKAECSAI